MWEPVFVGAAADDGAAVLPGARTIRLTAVGDGLAWDIPAGSLTAASWLSCDLLLEGTTFVGFHLNLDEGSGRRFTLQFAALNQCQARLRLALTACNQNVWLLGREGALLKRHCAGERVVPERVERIELVVRCLGDEPARLNVTPLLATTSEPPRLTEPLLPVGRLVDELGQTTLVDWPSRSRSCQEVTNRLREQLAAAPRQTFPASFSPWGGWTGRRLAASGFFRVERDERRWWLVDPAGHPFFSAGPCCVQPSIDGSVAGLESALTDPPAEAPGIREADRRGYPAVNYLGANFRRAFGDNWREAWAEIALSQLKAFGCNTVANWSSWGIARAAGFPYVRPLDAVQRAAPRVFRDFPDVFHDGFLADARQFAAQLTETAGDPALIGYFLMNEPQWGFATDSPAIGLLYNYPEGPARRELARWLGEKYGDEARLTAAWGLQTTFAALAAGPWTADLTPAARADLDAFSSLLVERYFGTLTAACRAVDPHHLNLGVRYYRPPQEWAMVGMKTFDVFSMNCYRERVPADVVETIAAAVDAPVMIGEWHFGALDVGLPASGIGRVASQADRGRAYRVYLEQAAALPACVGVHWFTLYDQFCLGRFDGENYNIGFVDICGRPYEALATAARASHERMYAVAAGEAPPFDDPPEYLSRLF